MRASSFHRLRSSADVFERVVGAQGIPAGGGLFPGHRFWWEAGRQFWLFTLYDKNEASDLSRLERKALKDMLQRELEARQS